MMTLMERWHMDGDAMDLRDALRPIAEEFAGIDQGSLERLGACEPEAAWEHGAHFFTPALARALLAIREALPTVEAAKSRVMRETTLVRETSS